MLAHLQRPFQAEALTESGHGHLPDVIASQLKRAFAPNSGLGIVREGGEAIELLKNSQIALGRFDILEATKEILPFFWTRHIGLGIPPHLDRVAVYFPRLKTYYKWIHAEIYYQTLSHHRS